VLKFFVVILLGGLVAVDGQAEPFNPPCNVAQARLLISLDALPEEVKALLGRSIAGVSGIADVNEKFNPTDAISDPAIPTRRLVKGTVSDTCIWMTVEHGGRGYYMEQLEFHLTEHGWVKVAVVRRSKM